MHTSSIRDESWILESDDEGALFIEHTREAPGEKPSEERVSLNEFMHAGDLGTRGILREMLAKLFEEKPRA